MLLQQANNRIYRIQVGNADVLFEFIYVGNTAYAHVLAAKALLAGVGRNGEKVDGKAFFVTDDNALALYDFLWKV
jgi:sterol-4alpha-carboxylate 3-dehydrogenase (decarboxylating)